VVDIGVPLDDPNTVYATNEAGFEYSYVPVETATPFPDGSIIHTVKEGENLQLIALSYGVSVSSIMEYSGLTGSSILYPEQQLVIQKAYDDSSPGLARTIAIGIPTETATFAPTFTARPPTIVTPEPTKDSPTPTLTTTPEAEDADKISFGMIGLLAIVLGIIVLVVFFIMYSRRR
jgi:LysM repeat protein